MRNAMPSPSSHETKCQTFTPARSKRLYVWWFTHRQIDCQPTRLWRRKNIRNSVFFYSLGFAMRSRSTDLIVSFLVSFNSQIFVCEKFCIFLSIFGAQTLHDFVTTFSIHNSQCAIVANRNNSLVHIGRIQFGLWLNFIVHLTPFRFRAATQRALALTMRIAKKF